MTSKSTLGCARAEPSKQSPAAIIEIARNRARENISRKPSRSTLPEQTAMIPARFATQRFMATGLPERPKR